jgi:arylsulfatase A-like enzyme
VARADLALLLLLGCGLGTGCDPRQAPATPNIILVSYDGLRADRTGAYGNPRAPTPTLDRMAAEGLRFEWAFSQSNESLFSHASMFTGRQVPELAQPVYESFTLPDSAVMVGEVLGVYGYSTAAFVAGAHIRGEYGFDQGFSVYDDRHDFGPMFSKAREALAWVDQRAREPFFLVLQSYDCHRPYLRSDAWFHPYERDYDGIADELLTRRFSVDRTFAGRYYPDFPIRLLQHVAGDRLQDPRGTERIAAWAERNADGVTLSEGDLEHVRAHYDGAAFALDIQLGRFFEALEQRGVLDDTLVILTADHGEDLQEHGYFGHRHSLHDTTTRVPLVLWGSSLPTQARGTVREDLAEAIDIVPTILAAAGAQPPAGLPGRDLLDPHAEDDGSVLQIGVLPQISLRTATHRLIFHGLPAASPLLGPALANAPLNADWFELYQLSTDPDELRNVVAEQPAEAERLRTAMLAKLAAMQRSAEAGAPPDDPALRELLRSRGYW